MAAALTELAQLADEGRGQQHEVLYGEDLRLKITPEGDGVQISLSWPIADTGTAE